MAVQNKNNNKKKNNVVKLHYMPRFNVGILLLTVIFIYLLISLYLYITKDKVLTYEVNAGQLVSDNTFSGIVLFDESAETSSVSGHINYFLGEDERAGAKTIICIVDETGSVSSALSANVMENGISTTAVNNIGHKLINYAKSYDPLDYHQTYNLLSTVTSSVNGFNAQYKVANLEALIGAGNNTVHIVRPSQSTLVSYTTDSLLGTTKDNITYAAFSTDNYTVSNLQNRDLIAVGDILYRKINSDSWEVVFPLTQNQVNLYADMSSVKVNFLSQNITTTAGFSIIYTSDGNYGLLTLSNYVVNFLDTRFVDFEISQNVSSGLKIPVSSVCEKEFYTIPTQYGCVGGDNSNTGFTLLTYDTQGNQTQKFIEATYYAEIDGYYYVNKDLFGVGDCIVMPPVSDTEAETSGEGEDNADNTVTNVADRKYIIGTVATLKGTYCVNKGYCQFRQVEILDRNDEYYIVKLGTKYGLSIYDHIILNADMVTENQIMY